MDRQAEQRAYKEILAAYHEECASAERAYRDAITIANTARDNAITTAEDKFFAASAAVKKAFHEVAAAEPRQS